MNGLIFLMMNNNRYYCPFCSSRFLFQKLRSDGVLICGVCGENLVKKPLVSIKQIFGLLALSSFLTPLIIMISYVIKDFGKEKLPKIPESLALLFIEK